MASVYDIELEQGSDAVIPFEMYDANDTPLDLSGYTARMQIRPSVGSATINDELTTENGRLVITGGTITATWPNAVTTAMRHGDSVYDIEIVRSRAFLKAHSSCIRRSPDELQGGQSRRPTVAACQGCR